MLLYPHIIRAELTMASHWRGERSDNGWPLAESSRKKQRLWSDSLRTRRSLGNGEKKKGEERQMNRPIKAQICVALLC